MNRLNANNVALIAVALMLVLTVGRWLNLGYEDVISGLTLALVALVIFLGLRGAHRRRPQGRPSG